MFKTLSLTTKLALVPAIALLGLFAFVGYTALQLAETDRRLLELESHSYPTLERTDAVIFQFSRLPGLFNSAVAAGEAGVLDEAREVLSDIGAQQDRLAELFKEHPARTQALRAWREALTRYADHALDASGKLIAGTASFADLDLQGMGADLQDTQALATAFRANAYEDFQRTLATARQDNADTTRLGLWLSALLILLVGAGGWLVTRNVMGSVRRVIASLQSIAQGDGDLTRRVDEVSGDEIGTMIRLFNRLLDKLQDTIRQITDAASPLDEVSQALYRLTRESERHAHSQHEHAEAIDRDIQSVAAQIGEVAEHSRQASDAANSAARQAQDTRGRVGELASGIEDLGASVTSAAQAMSQLEEQTQEVGSVLTVIHSIAEQTNLLALNAAIEAARAGEQGRGFAVVADEVRNLAQKTASSTAQIQSIIQRLQHSANSVLDAMTANAEKAGASVGQSRDAIGLLDEISRTVAGIDTLNADIARLTAAQIDLSSDIARKTRTLQQDAQATAQGAAENARLGAQLVETGDHLRAATAQFRV